MKRFSKNNSGFTFIECLIAIVILVMASITASDLIRGSVRAVHDSQQYTIATLLLQKTMAELETKLETEGIDKGCDKKKDGKFDPPYDKFTWTTYCTEIDFQISETASKVLEDNKDKDKSDDDKDKQDIITKFIMKMASDYISKSLRELHVEVNWTNGKTKRQIDATTHFVRYDQPLTLPSIGAGT